MTSQKRYSISIITGVLLFFFLIVGALIYFNLFLVKEPKPQVTHTQNTSSIMEPKKDPMGTIEKNIRQRWIHRAYDSLFFVVKNGNSSIAALNDLKIKEAFISHQKVFVEICHKGFIEEYKLISLKGILKKIRLQKVDSSYITIARRKSLCTYFSLQQALQKAIDFNLEVRIDGKKIHLTSVKQGLLLSKHHVVNVLVQPGEEF